jgi:hypothetical protein
MRQRVDSLGVMLFPARYARSTADKAAERLLAGQGVPPRADASARALASVLTAAAQPGTAAELSGEDDAVAAFLLAARPAIPRKALSRKAQRSRGRLRPSPPRVPVLAGAFAIAVIAALYGSAAADMLPASFQQQVSRYIPFVPAPGTGTPGVSPGTSGPGTGQSGVPTLTSSDGQPQPSGEPNGVKTGQPTGAKPTATPSPTPTTCVTHGNGNGNGEVKCTTKGASGQPTAAPTPTPTTCGTHAGSKDPCKSSGSNNGNGNGNSNS